MLKFPRPKRVIVRCWSADQKAAMNDLLSEGIETAVYIGHTARYIDYQIDFAYSINLTAFLFDYKSLYQQYKFQIIEIKPLA